eukprot:2668386-Amphidinium_carterae.1
MASEPTSATGRNPVSVKCRHCQVQSRAAHLHYDGTCALRKRVPRHEVQVLKTLEAYRDAKEADNSWLVAWLAFYIAVFSGEARNASLSQKQHKSTHVI